MVCPMCRKLFENPKCLPCHHSYCEECLKIMQKDSGNIICLKCRNKATVPVGGVKNLPNNYFMGCLINKLILNYKLENEIGLRCEDCDEDDAVVTYCTDCKLFLCCYCKESHKYSKSHCSHNLISLAELRGSGDLIQSKSEFPTCQEHDLELEYYCESCEKLVCVQCTGEHEGHKYDVAKKVSNKYLNVLNRVATPIDILIEDLTKLHESIENVREVIRQQGDKISKEIDLCYDEMIEKLLEQKQNVKQKVCDTVLQKEKAIKGQLEEVIQTEQDIFNLKRIRDSIQASSDQEVLSASSQLVYSLKRFPEKCRKLGSKPIESANIKIFPSNEPLVQVVGHYATIDSLSFETNVISSSIQRSRMAMLEIVTKDSKGEYYPKGGCDITAELESRTGETIPATVQVTDNNDGTYVIYFAVEKVGEMNLLVFVNKHEIKNSPYRIVVREKCLDPSKIITSHNNFGQLWGIGCSNNSIWAVADWTENCVHVFDHQDKLISKFGSRGNKNGQFIHPFDVTFDDNNNLYVTDCHNHRVQKFNIHGDYLLQFGGKGTAEGQLKYPMGMTAYLDKVYVADLHNNRISVFYYDGRFSTVIGQNYLSQYFGIAVNISGEILAVDRENHCICKFTLGGHFISNISLHKGSGSVELKDIWSLTTDSNGFILIAHTSLNNHCISIFDKIGNCIQCFESDNQFKFPHGIAVSPNGNLYVSDTGNKRVQIFSGYI